MPYSTSDFLERSFTDPGPTDSALLDPVVSGSQHWDYRFELPNLAGHLGTQSQGPFACAANVLPTEPLLLSLSLKKMLKFSVGGGESVCVCHTAMWEV